MDGEEITSHLFWAAAMGVVSMKDTGVGWSGQAWVPPWIYQLGTPVWVSALDKTVLYVNERACELLGVTPSKCLGRLCHKVVAAKTEAGEPFCRAHCSIVERVGSGQEIEPRRVRIGRGRRARWIKLVVIVAHAPDFTGPRLVHCVVDDDREQRFYRYLSRVMARTTGPDRSSEAMESFRLSEREQEVLTMLAEDESLHAIASKLHLSYTTVRNHVQHILSKLGVHSIMEAVAFYLLTAGGPLRPRRARKR